MLTPYSDCFHAWGAKMNHQKFCVTNQALILKHVPWSLKDFSGSSSPQPTYLYAAPEKSSLHVHCPTNQWHFPILLHSVSTSRETIFELGYPNYARSDLQVHCKQSPPVNSSSRVQHRVVKSQTPQSEHGRLLGQVVVGAFSTWLQSPWLPLPSYLLLPVYASSFVWTHWHAPVLWSHWFQQRNDSEYMVVSQLAISHLACIDLNNLQCQGWRVHHSLCSCHVDILNTVVVYQHTMCVISRNFNYRQWLHVKALCYEWWAVIAMSRKEMRAQNEFTEAIQKQIGLAYSGPPLEANGMLTILLTPSLQQSTHPVV